MTYFRKMANGRFGFVLIFCKDIVSYKNNNLDFTTVKQLKYIYAFEQFPMPAIYNNLFTN